jgi:hypothetical protein
MREGNLKGRIKDQIGHDSTAASPPICVRTIALHNSAVATMLSHKDIDCLSLGAKLLNRSIGSLLR